MSIVSEKVEVKVVGRQSKECMREIEREEKWAEDGSLGDTVEKRSRVRFGAKYEDTLRAVG